MTNEEILRAAIEKAVKNGWENNIIRKESPIVLAFVYEMIFSHEFAKAFWGDDIIVEEFEDYYLSGEGIDEKKTTFRGGKISYPYCESASVEIRTPAWKLYLQQLVLEKDPLKYLEKFL